MVKHLTTKGARRWIDKRLESDERREKSENDRRENESPVHGAYRKEAKRCKYCRGKHRIGKRDCPAFGKRCSACRIMNHFASQCMVKAKVNVVRERERERAEATMNTASHSSHWMKVKYSVSIRQVIMNMRESFLLQ